MPAARISGVGMYVPPKVVRNDDLRAFYDTSDEWIYTRSGIKERRWAEEPASTAELGYYAAQEALQAAGKKAVDLDLIIFATLSPDLYFPGSGVLLQQKLGLETTPALDIRQQCSGFVYGLSIADQFIRTGMYRTILLVGAEVQSTWIDYAPEGRTVGVLFGDGAGAVVIEATEALGRGIRSSHLYSQGAYAMELCIAEPSSATRRHILPGSYGMRPYMNGKEVFRHAVQRMGEAIQVALSTQNWHPNEVDLYVLHQANIRIVQAVAEFFGLPMDKFFNNIHKYGNTTAASIPICLYEAQAEGRLKAGDKVILAAFGSGFTWGSVALIW
ncbi:MAG: beta-ketoacyl-ACP synthase III [Bacteroidia bacterium]|nr:ketoacyl-ACP synthase III [Bacteroidia bacterium]MDW8014660.1 beta-ketoacyl-ACP synthase III [Bacteroidia bacterium]